MQYKDFVEDIITRCFKEMHVPGTPILVCSPELGPLNYTKCYIVSLHWNYKNNNYLLYRERVCATIDAAEDTYTEEFKKLLVTMITSPEIWNLIDTKLLSSSSNTNM